MSRKAISKKTRFEIFKRDGFKCQYCGAHPPVVILHVDHITPVAEGGENDADNLVTACAPCNLGKGARSLTDVPVSLQDKAAAVAEREEQIAGYNEVMRQRRERIDQEAYDVADIFADAFGHPGSCRQSEFQSIRRFVERLGLDECIEAMTTATTKTKPWGSETKTFRYFCGICWRKIREGESA